MANESIRLGLIGAGRNTRDRHIPGFQQVEGVELAAVANRSRESGAKVREAQRVLRELGGVLGLTFDTRQDNQAAGSEPFTQLLVETRTPLRESKQYSLADKIRSDLLELGVELEDTARGTDWRFR